MPDFLLPSVCDADHDVMTPVPASWACLLTSEQVCTTHPPGQSLATPKSLQRPCSAFTSAVSPSHRLQEQVPALAPLFAACDAPWLAPAATWAVRLSPFLYSFIGISVLDKILGEDSDAGTPASVHAWYTPLYRAICHGCIYLHLTITAGAVAAAPHVSVAVALCNVLNVATAGAVAFTVAHEMIHSKRRLDSALGNALLTCLCYKHFSLSHHGHHAKAATPEDTASAPFRQSVRPLFFKRSRYHALLHTSTR